MPDQKRKRSVSPRPVDPKKRIASTADCTNLPQDLVYHIAKRIDSWKNLTDIGAVSKSWRLAEMTIKKDFVAKIGGPLILQHMLPRDKKIVHHDFFVSEYDEDVTPFVFLSLPKKEGVYDYDGDATAFEFLSLTKHKIRIPNPFAETKNKVCSSSRGWLLTVSEKSNFKQLVHPFNHAKVDLPPCPYNKRRPMRAMLSSNPCFTSDYTLLISNDYEEMFLWEPRLGRQSLRVLKLPRRMIISDLTYCQGRYYFVENSGRVSFLYDVDTDVPKVWEAAPEIPSELLGVEISEHAVEFHLVEFEGALLLVVLTISFIKYGVNEFGFRVFKIPFKKGTCSWPDWEMKNLGNRSLFVSYRSTSFSLDASEFQCIKANCIYFIRNTCNVIYEAGIYNMDDGTTVRDFEKYFQDYGMPEQYFRETRQSQMWVDIYHNCTPITVDFSLLG